MLPEFFLKSKRSSLLAALSSIFTNETMLVKF